MVEMVFFHEVRWYNPAVSIGSLLCKPLLTWITLPKQISLKEYHARNTQCLVSNTVGPSYFHPSKLIKKSYVSKTLMLNEEIAIATFSVVKGKRKERFQLDC